jgi:IS30 family transposase
LEFNDAGERRAQIFYCRPSMPSDKPHVEKNHVELRRILPKGSSFDDLTQADINLVLSHINSFSRKKLNGKSPIESFSFLYGEELCLKLGITKIPPNDVVLKPHLLKR